MERACVVTHDVFASGQNDYGKQICKTKLTSPHSSDVRALDLKTRDCGWST